MYILTYTSIATPGLDEADIADILETARSHNSTVGITGCLLFHNGIFIQVLEGPEKEVSNLFKKISEDKRHCNVMVVDDYYKQERRFENWSMAYSAFKKDEMEKLGSTLSMEDFISLSTLNLSSAQTIRTFWTMAKQLLSL